MKSVMTMTALLAAVLATSVHAHDGHDKDSKGAASKVEAHGAAAAEQTPFGIAGTPKRVTRVIKLIMGDDMRFTPGVLQVKQGETVKLLVTNGGKMLHEIVLGTKETIEEHAAMMRKHPDMAHSAPYMLHVKAGETGEIVWRFNKAGQFDFACLLPGHFEAGMRGTITVAPAVTGKDR
jgi:uncharacterized cupredoxin-like copper-binding protein